jgi:DNA-damage-inducible protein D
VRDIVPATATPFDAIRHATPEGREWWSARDLMPLLGYDQWRRFADAIGRARISGHNAGHDMARHIATAGKMVPIGSGAQREAEDFHLSRLACYLVAMNGDPRKPEVAAAQTYFAVRTREAETHQAAAPAIPRTYAEALRAAADQAERAELAEAKVIELTPSASAWNELADAAGDYSVADAAKVLNRDPAISTGERKLYRFMCGLGWVFRRDGRWKAYQTQVNNGRLTEKVNEPFMRNGELFAPAPTVRITPKGLAELHRRLGGTGDGQQIALVATS